MTPSPIVVFLFTSSCLGRFFFNIPLPLYVVFVEDGRLDKQLFLTTWRSIPKEEYKTINNVVGTDVNLLLQKLEAYNVFFIAKTRHPDSGKEFIYMSVKLTNGVVILLELFFQGTQCTLCSKTIAEIYTPMLQAALEWLLQHP
jgi:AP-1 complex subunit beta-1